MLIRHYHHTNTAGAAIMKQKQTLTPTIYIPVNLYSRIVDMTKHEVSNGNEYSYMGVFIPFVYDYTKSEQYNMDNIELNNLCLARIETSYQTGTSVRTTFAKNPNDPLNASLGIHEISDRLFDLDENAVPNCWIHTHPNGLPATPSGRDIDQLNEYFATVATRSFNPYFASIIINTSGDIYVKILHKDYEYVIPEIKIIEPRYIKASPVADKLLDSKDYTISELKEEFNKYFVKPVYTPTPSPSYGNHYGQSNLGYQSKYNNVDRKQKNHRMSSRDWDLLDEKDWFETSSSYLDYSKSKELAFKEIMYSGRRVELNPGDTLIIGHRQYVTLNKSVYIPTFVKDAVTSFDSYKDLVRIEDITSFYQGDFKYKNYKSEKTLTDEIGILYYYFDVDTNEDVYWFVNELGNIEQIPDSCVKSNAI